jgi:hypothetical protein
MRAMTNTIAALSLVGAAAMSAPAPASAQGVYFGAPGVSLGIGVPPYYGYPAYPYWRGYPGYRPYWGGYRRHPGWHRHGFYGGPAYGYTGRPYHWRPRAYGFYGRPHWGYRHHGFYGRPYGLRHYGYRGHRFYGRAITGGHRFHCF